MVGMPIDLAVFDAIQRDMAQRPEHLIRIAEVPAFDLIGFQPYAPESIGRRIRRDLHHHVLIHDFSIGFAAAPRDPRAAQSIHHGIKRAGEAAGCFFPDEPFLDMAMFVRFAIGDDDQTRKSGMLLRL